jgi:hypothetical protein
METKKYYAVNCHYNMVVTVDVAALNEQDAKEQAKHMADDVSLDHFGECYGTDACIADEGELTEENKAMVEKCRIEMDGNCELVQKLRDKYNGMSEYEGYAHIDDITEFAKEVLVDVLDDDRQTDYVCHDFEEEFHAALCDLIVSMGVKYYKKMEKK